jgi:tetratricopeptide (TPR) repeat protein
LMKRSITLDPTADNYYKLARLQNDVNKYGEALESIKLAIAMQPDIPQYYLEQKRAETGLRVPEAEREVHLAEGFMTIGEARLRDMKSTSDADERAKFVERAEDAFRRSLDILTPLPKNDKVTATLNLVNAQLARLKEVGGKKPETR